MTDAQFRCTLRSADGLERNNCVNTFAVTGSFEPAELGDLASIVAAFYQAEGSGPYPVGAYINDTIFRTDGLLIEAILSPQTPPNPPAFSEVYTLPAANATGPLPQEVAVCLSMYTSTYFSSATPGRERGRVYVGPLTSLAGTDAGLLAPLRVAPALQVAMTEGIEGVQGGLEALLASLAVWSRAAGTFHPVVGGWVDNEFDTQRRRGRDSTGREFYTFNG